MTVNKLYEVLQNDKGYQKLVEKSEGLLKEIAKRGLEERADVLEKEYEVKILLLEEEIKAYGEKQYEESKRELEEIKFQYKDVMYDDPQQEMLRREDMKARLTLYTDEELIGYMNTLKPEDLTVYDLNLLENTITVKLSGNDLERALTRFEALKYATLVDPEKAEVLENKFSMWNGLKMIRYGGNTFIWDPEFEEYHIRDIHNEYTQLIEVIRRRDQKSAKSRKR